MNKKTNKNFWEDVWGAKNIKYELNEKFLLDKNIMNYFEKFIGSDKKSVFEIGCSPGRFLAYLNKKGHSISGIDYSKKGNIQLKKNFKTLGIKKYTLYEEDLFKFNHNKKYDVVMSFGFIEHFDDPDTVVEKHIELLKKNGLLILGIPVFNGITGFFQKLNNPKILSNHNLDIMNLNYFSELTNKFNLKLVKNDYLGGFDPNMVMQVKSVTFNNILSRIILKIILITRLNYLLKNMNVSPLSSYIIFFAKKID